MTFGEVKPAPQVAAPSFGRLPRLAPPLGIRPDFTAPTDLLRLSGSQTR